VGESDLHSKTKCWAIQLYFFVNRSFTYLAESQAMIVLTMIVFLQIVAIIYGSLYFWFSSLVVSSVHQVYNTKRFDSFYSCMVILEQDPSIQFPNKKNSRVMLRFLCFLCYL
jgi:hypothetical protein